MQMNPRQIEAFRTVMLTGSMTVAAEMLRVTQPAVSRLIKDLEAELKLILFRREGNRLVPSHEATILFAEVDRFYLGMEQIAKIANDLRHAKVGSLRIAAIGSLSMTCIPKAIGVFHASRPAVDVTLESLNTIQTLNMVAGRHFDVGFALIGGEFPGVEQTPLPPIDMVCAMPAHYPLVDKEWIEPQDLKELPFISLGQNSPQRIKIDQMFAEMGIGRVHVLLQTSLSASAMTLVAAGQGATIIDSFTANHLKNPAVVIKPFRPHMFFDVAAVRPLHHQHSRLCQDFIEIVVDMFKKEAANPMR